MKMPKYHGLGNDYLVLSPAEMKDFELTPDAIRLICSPHYGAGSDGILTGPFPPASADFQDIMTRSGAIAGDCICALRIWNPDGSEAEKSGNGLRIFSRYLYDCGIVKAGEQFSLLTLGGMVKSTVFEPKDSIRVEMGKVRFASRDFPCWNENSRTDFMKVLGEKLEYCPATVGNPHCIVLNANADEETARKFGPHIENSPLFPNRINVQFLKVLGPHDIYITIWERGAGYTLASGSSSTAAASVAVRLGLCQSPVTVHEPGGELKVEIDQGWNTVQTGPVRVVYNLEWLGE